MTVETLEDMGELAQQLRVDSIRCSTAAGSGHPTSSMSAADVMAVLQARYLRYDWRQPDNPANDHLIFSKGHASPLLYSMFKAAGVVSDEELVNTYRRFGARLEGHPTPLLPWVDVATGSLGQGLPDGVGVALAGRYLDELPYRVWVLCGDSEMAEGSMWEAFDKAAYYRLDNLTAIVDVNRLGQRGPTELGWDLDTYTKRIEAFGCRAIPIDGHDLGEIDKALAVVGGAGQPTVILARTRKGRGFSEVEDREGWHGRPLPPEMAERAITELGGQRHLTVSGLPPQGGPPRVWPSGEVRLPVYELGAKVATRKAFGEALAAVGADGPSQMALEDLAMMRAVHGSTVLYPSDATSTAYLVAEMAGRGGVVYLRTTRGAYPVLYGPDETFPAGGAKAVRSSPEDRVTLIGAGVTLHNCLAAAEELGNDGIAARVLDLYSVKPVDTQALLAAAAATGGRLVVAEDHYPEGGIGEAVLEALSDAGHPVRIAHLAVRGLPGSGTPAELMEAAGISASHIVQAARDLLGS